MEKTIIRRIWNPEKIIDPSLHPILQRIYQSRGIQSKIELEKSLAQLLPWHNLSHIDQANELLYQALIKQKKMLIIGDFDADGATSTAIAVTALKAFGFKYVDFLVPNRFTYGYGLTPEIVAAAQDLQPDVII